MEERVCESVRLAVQMSGSGNLTKNWSLSQDLRLVRDQQCALRGGAQPLPWGAEPWAVGGAGSAEGRLGWCYRSCGGFRFLL